jgi:hypothetical protein
MARPLYMLCCLSGSVDKETKQISHFNVIEKLEVHLQRLPVAKEPAPTLVFAPLTFQIVATWSPGPDDRPSDTYEAQILFQRPEESGKKIVHRSTFDFAGGGNHRFIVNFTLLPRDDFKTGVLWFACRIRKTGTTKWIRQEYSIPVIVTIIADAHESKKNGKKKIKRHRSTP